MLKMRIDVPACERQGREVRQDRGFSLPELLISVTILLIISSAVVTGLLQLTNSQKTIANRTEMHSGVRSATELLQQEVGQAGRVALPGDTTLGGNVSSGLHTIDVNMTIGGVTAASVAGLFPGEQLTIDGGSNQETVTLTAVDAVSKRITATFANAHAAGAAVNVFGGFSTGLVPPQPGFTNGSTGSILKLYGDINGDGNMVYVEYTCDTVTGNLYRNAIAYDAVSKAAATADQVLLSNIQANPGGTACFTYLPSPLPVVNGTTYVLDVAITLTVKTQLLDPITKQYQTETKALLNVSPRNVFDVWQLASVGSTGLARIQPMPASVQALLP